MSGSKITELEPRPPTRSGPDPGPVRTPAGDPLFGEEPGRSHSRRRTGPVVVHRQENVLLSEPGGTGSAPSTGPGPGPNWAESVIRRADPAAVPRAEDLRGGGPGGGGQGPHPAFIGRRPKRGGGGGVKGGGAARPGRGPVGRRGTGRGPGPPGRRDPRGCP